jgi:hypothetical protein
MSSLSAEPCDDSSFICTAFDVKDEGWDAFRKREEEFELRMVPYHTLTGTHAGQGLLCVGSTDEAYIQEWGQERFDRLYTQQGLATIWGWSRASGLLPCHAYLRHCILAAEKLGPDVATSFLDQTFLVDRCTTIRSYLDQHREVMTTLPPPTLRERYGG